MKFFAHPHAIIESRSIGARTRIWAFSHVQPKSVIGANCNIGEHCFIEDGVTIGDCVTVKNGVHLWKGITVKDHVFVGPNVTFTNDRCPRSPRSPHISKKYKTENWLTPIVIGEGCTIGANATIVGPVRLERFCFVGAGSVVLNDVRKFELVVGNPARHSGWVNKHGERVKQCPKK